MLARLFVAALADGRLSRLSSFTHICEAEGRAAAWYNPQLWAAQLLMSNTPGLWHMGAAACFVQNIGAPWRGLCIS